jgi:hypothetical protein
MSGFLQEKSIYFIANIYNIIDSIILQADISIKV